VQTAAGKHIILTCDPTNIRAVLFDQFREFGLGRERRGNHATLLGHGIFTQDGQDWFRSRQVLRPCFHGKEPVRLDLVEEVFCRELEKHGDGTAVDLKALFMSLTADVSTVFLFGGEVIGGESARSSFNTAFSTGMHWLHVRSRYGLLYWLKTSREFRNACSMVKSIGSEWMKVMVTKLSADPESVPQSTCKALLDSGLDENSVRDQLLNLLIAGRDTTANFLGWVFYMLASDSRVLELLQEEITTVLGHSDQVPRYEDLEKLVYLKQILNESKFDLCNRPLKES
jgi:cytochrome P450